MSEGAVAGGSSGPVALQAATSVSEKTMRSANRRIWTSRKDVSGVLAAPKMRLPGVHLQHTSSLK